MLKFIIEMNYQKKNIEPIMYGPNDRQTDVKK